MVRSHTPQLWSIALSLYYIILSIPVPSSPPQTPRGNAMSSTIITLFWDPPPADAQNGIITQYRINITEVETERPILRFSSTTSVNVTSLHPYYTYNCAIAAETIIGAGPYTSVITVVTLQDGNPLCAAAISFLYSVCSSSILYAVQMKLNFIFFYYSSEWSSTKHYSSGQQCQRPLHHMESSST